MLLNRKYHQRSDQLTNNIYFLKHYQATFDAKDSVEFENLPTVAELTMCHWMKLDENWTGKTSYFHSMYARRSHITSFLEQEKGEIILTMEILADTRKPQDYQR